MIISNNSKLKGIISKIIYFLSFLAEKVTTAPLSDTSMFQMSLSPFSISSNFTKVEGITVVVEPPILLLLSHISVS